MGSFSGPLSAVANEVATLVAGLLGALWVKVVASLTGPLGGVWTKAVALTKGPLSFLWSLALVVTVVGLGAGLRLLGTEDVYETLGRRLGDGESSLSLPEVSEEDVLDEAGRFSGTAMERATGMTPGEFIRLYVDVNGGRVAQSTLNATLPWSKSTVSRQLDALERQGVVHRVEAGRQNVVCTPERLPNPND